MVGAFSIEVIGLKDLDKDIQRLKNESPKLGQNIIKELGKRTKRFAKQAIRNKWPKRKGSEDLKNKITRQIGKNFVWVKANTSYASYVEFGTRGHPIPNNPLWGLRGREHPGAKSYPSKHFMSRAVNRAIKQFEKIEKLERKKLKMI